MNPMYKFAGYIARTQDGQIILFAASKPLFDKAMAERGIPQDDNIVIKAVYTHE